MTKSTVKLGWQYALSPSSKLYKERHSLQTEFHFLSTSETVNLVTQSHHRFYEHGEKAGKILAHHFRESTPRLITEICTSSEQSTINQQEMNYEFK